MKYQKIIFNLTPFNNLLWKDIPLPSTVLVTLTLTLTLTLVLTLNLTNKVKKERNLMRQAAIELPLHLR